MTSSHPVLHTGLDLLSFRHFQSATLVIESQSLHGNPLGDPTIRRTPVLVPKGRAPAKGWPVVLILAGFTGNGPNYFNLKTFESNMPQVIDQCCERGEAPRAVYVFCDGMTKWGGSQFINSLGTGRYEDYIVRDLVPAIQKTLQVSPDASDWCVCGGSSGGYGALSLASQYPERFSVVAAIAPDSFFEASLLPEIWAALPIIKKCGGVPGVLAELESGRLMKRKESHTVLNAIAMGLCYAPDGKGAFEIPVDEQTGELKPEIWKKWKASDPVVFLRERIEKVRSIDRIYLDVGTRDQFHLQYGAQQIKRTLESSHVSLDYSEFDGTHFDIGERRPEMWKWLSTIWRV